MILVQTLTIGRTPTFLAILIITLPTNQFQWQMHPRWSRR